jgi:hypothetical protein
MMFIRLREAFGLRVLKKIFWANREEPAGDWRKLRNVELHD